jgi:hypothetical protein
VNSTGLKKAAFPKAWAFFYLFFFVKDLKFAATFACEQLVLLRHEGKSWRVLSTPVFGNQNLPEQNNQIV